MSKIFSLDSSDIIGIFIHHTDKEEEGIKRQKSVI